MNTTVSLKVKLSAVISAGNAAHLLHKVCQDRHTGMETQTHTHTHALYIVIILPTLSHSSTLSFNLSRNSTASMLFPNKRNAMQSNRAKYTKWQMTATQIHRTTHLIFGKCHIAISLKEELQNINTPILWCKVKWCSTPLWNMREEFLLTSHTKFHIFNGRQIKETRTINTQCIDKLLWPFFPDMFKWDKSSCEHNDCNTLSIHFGMS